MDLALDRVSHAYRQPGGEPVYVLSSVSWTFASGSSTALLGRSGSGKSTLLSILGLLLTPSGGACQLGGRDAVRLSERQRAELRNVSIGFLFQRSNLAPALPIWKSVVMPSLFTVGGTRTRRGQRDRAEEVLASVGLPNLGHRRPSQLSGGQRQRAALARALFLAPPVLLADEPTGSLDEETGDLIAGVLFRQCEERGMTLVLATHDDRLAALADERVELSAGRIGGASLQRRATPR